MLAYTLDYGPMELICQEGDPSSDLFFLKSGKLLICTVNGTEVKVLARIEAGVFVGELSFFDGRPRASHIVTLEKTTLIQIPKQEFQSYLPYWFLETGKNLTKKIRLLDEIINDSHIKKIGQENQKALSIEEQRKVLSIITHQHT